MAIPSAIYENRVTILTREICLPCVLACSELALLAGDDSGLGWLAGRSRLDCVYGEVCLDVRSLTSNM